MEWGGELITKKKDLLGIQAQFYWAERKPGLEASHGKVRTVELPSHPGH